MQVAERGQHLQHVGDGLRGRQKRTLGGPALAQQLFERRAADILHHDVSDGATVAAGMLDKVEDLDDIRMLDLRQEPALGHRGGHGVGIGRVQQALQHHPPVVDLPVDGEIDPAQPAVRQRARDLVLPADQIAAPQLGGEGEAGAAVRAEPLDAARHLVARSADGPVAVGAEAPVLRDLRVGEHGGGRIDPGNARHLDHARAQAAAPRPGGGGPGARRTGAGGRSRHGEGHGDGALGRRVRRGRRPAGIAVTIENRSAATRFGALHPRLPDFSAMIC